MGKGEGREDKKGGVGGRRGGEREGETHAVEERQIEELVVPEAHTVVDPLAVVVHALDTVLRGRQMSYTGMRVRFWRRRNLRARRG